MTDQFVAEIRMFAFNFAPKNWAFCNGQILPLSQNTALFSLLGTTYGGDGRSNFALPNLQGSAAMHPGQGPGLNLHDLGETGGSETVTLLESEIPLHTHSMSASTAAATAAPSGAQLGKPAKTGLQASLSGLMYSTATPNTTMAATATTVAGGSSPHNNMMPYLTLNYCIALAGVFPQRP